MERLYLIVFIGKPGVGKSTIIRRLFPQVRVIDVRPFVQHYAVAGYLDENKIINGHDDMYRYIARQSEQMIALELDTSQPEYNYQQLRVLAELRRIIVFICEASITTCLRRLLGRPGVYDISTAKRRMARDFPAAHLKLLREQAIIHHRVDMERSVDEITADILRIMGSW